MDSKTWIWFFLSIHHLGNRTNIVMYRVLILPVPKAWKNIFMVIIVCSRRWMWSVKCYIPMDISHNRGWIISMNVRITFCYLLNVINFIKKSLWGGIRLYIRIFFLLLFYVSVYVNSDSFRIMISWTNRTKQN